MASQTVIDLTNDDESKQPVVDLTRDSSVTPAPSRFQSPSLANGRKSKDGASRQKGKERRRKNNNKQSEAPEQTPEANEPAKTKSLAERLQGSESNNKRTANTSSKPLSKRKRRESIDSTATAHATHDESRPRPPKRQKSDNTKQKAIHNATSSAPLRKANGKTDRKAVDASDNLQAPGSSSKKEQEGDSREEKGEKKASKSKKSKSRRSSQSPMPPSVEPKLESKRKTAPRARSASVPISPTGSSLFFVDVQPSVENKHIEEPVKSVYRLESGNLLLPEHVLLETVEEAIMTPGNEVFPPPTPGLSQSDEDEIAIVDDRGIRRYWEPQIEAAEVEECRTCGQFHASKLCIGTSVCFTCGSTAHTARQCPFKTVCFRCGRTGHIRADCPVPTAELQRTWDCDLCGSQQHGTQTCSRNWRIYKYRDSETRDRDIATRLALKDLVMAGDESVDEEKFVGLEPWCYSCGMKGHLGDDCNKVNTDDRPSDPSAFGQWNVLYGPFAPRYRRVAEEVASTKGSLRPVVFGDQILDEMTLSFDPSQQRFESKVFGNLPLRPGESGRQRERERMARSRVDDRDEEQDWFSNRVERPSGYERDRNSFRDRERARDRRRRDDRNRERDRNEDRYRDRYPPRRDDDNTSRRGPEDRKGGRSSHRPRSPLIPPPPLPPPAQQAQPRHVYPTSHDMAAGYETQPANGLSIRGAADRHRASSHSQTNSQRPRDDPHEQRQHHGRERDRRRKDDSRGNSRR